MKKLRTILKAKSTLWTPLECHKLGVEFVTARKYSGLFADPGIGKTSITLEALRLLRAKGAVKKTCIIAPLRVVYDTWPDEIKTWRQFNDTKYEIFHDRDPRGIAESGADVILVNFAYVQKMFSTFKSPLHITAKNFKRMFGFDSLVIDELTAFKNTSSKRYKLFKKVIPAFKWRLGLTGTPMANRLDDLFGQIFVLDGGATFGPYVTHFRNQYFVRGGYGGYSYVPQNDAAVNTIYRKISPFVLRMSADDYVDMPSLIIRDIKVSMPDNTAAKYAELEKDLITQVNDTTVEAPTKAACLNKCRQFASGCAYSHDDSILMPSTKQKVVEIHKAKYEAIKALYDELQGEPLLIGIGYRFEADVLKKIFPKMPVIYGGTKSDDASKWIREWNENKIPVMAAHPASMAHGVNLQKGGARHVCWLTLPWDYEQYDQFNRRLYRQGNRSSKVYIHRVLTKGTVDDYVKVLLQRKRVAQDGLFEFLKREMIKRG